MSATVNISDNKLQLSEDAYNKLKEGILSGNIVRGKTYTQGVLAKILNMAISPIKVAINKLESEGLIIVFPRSGIQIIDTDFALTRNTYQLRVILEREGLKSYIRSVSDEEIQSFKTRHIELQRAISTPSSQTNGQSELAQLDSELHKQFILSLDNQIITKSYLANEDLIRLTRLDRLDLASQEMISSSIKEHIELIDAIAARDQLKALECLDDHLAKSIKRAMGLWGF
ncbi:GntR family transcriptional regulator [Paraglaciecola arctica]|uniref:GntR family transcriptional regulator n=1 Tax=Paraglaciecola arctica TaxID=1128911 RepID=UPI001C0668CC|nr:GntR family transcriptional regulator [Paraglaciecola arctica]MBU3003872.1 GntR family transcriptional regulator [Paraglaciecola arctica]|tara:strand:- start:66055 stop:66741 length:687 start_codon:yes stop_codon:yes gene_type:complete